MCILPCPVHEKRNTDLTQYALLGLLFFLSGCTDTTYAPGYSESAFESIRVGLDSKSVQKVLGTPLSKTQTQKEWSLFYIANLAPASSKYTILDPNQTLRFHLDKDGLVRKTEGTMTKPDKLTTGSKRTEVIQSLGAPYTEVRSETGEIWHYSQQSPANTHYWVRDILFGATDTVIGKRAELYFDRCGLRINGQRIYYRVTNISGSRLINAA